MNKIGRHTLIVTACNLITIDIAMMTFHFTSELANKVILIESKILCTYLKSVITFI